MVKGFAQSQEFINKTAQDFVDWVRAQGSDDQLAGGSGYNSLTGGRFSDWFIFDQAGGGSHGVQDLEVWDELHFNGFGYAREAEVRSHMTQENGFVTFCDQGLRVTLWNTHLADITDEMLVI